MINLRRLIFITVLMLAVGESHSADIKADNDKLYKTLDSLISVQSELIAEKESRIRAITDGVEGIELSLEQEYHLNNKLYDEYEAFKFDSALCYIQKNVDIQRQLANESLSAACLIRMAHILAVSGLFDKAEKMLGEVSVDRIDGDVLLDYYNQRGELNLYHSEFALSSPFLQDYIDSAQYYRQLILQKAPKDSYYYVFNQSTYICEQGDADRAISLLGDYLPLLSQGSRRYSVVASTLAYFYQRKQEVQWQEHYLLLSAISDLRGAILENNSLRELSAILMQRGELEKAYAYLSHASIDAQNYGSRLRSIQVARLAPLITQAYDMQRQRTQQRTNMLLIIITVIALLLVCTIVFTLSLFRKRRIASEQISRMNAELSNHNSEVQTMNSQMKEANRIKEEYIGRFLELCSNLIYRGEERLKQFNRLARDRRIEELYAQLKDGTSLSDGIRLFHQNFDTAFLNIYPNFISDVNRLMTKENRFDIDEHAGRLTTELRVLALIRLGISDNQKIAGILRSSITTVYTYRSKMKAKAFSKDTFEEEVRKISAY